MSLFLLVLVVGSQVAEFLGSERITLAKLLTAQAMISDHMEGTWYKPYLDYLQINEEQEIKPASLATIQETVEHTKRTFHCKERTVSWEGRGGVVPVYLPALPPLAPDGNRESYGPHLLTWWSTLGEG